jgi:hypothetical protein
MLLDKDLEKTIITDYIKLKLKREFLQLTIFLALPSKNWVYYIHDEKEFDLH